MGVRFYLIFLQVAAHVLVSVQATNFTNTEISDQSGLYCESVGKVRFTPTDWRLISYIDIARLKSQQPSIEKYVLERVSNTCKWFTTKETCSGVLNQNILLQKSKQIEEYFDKIYDVTDGSSTEDLNTRFGFLHILKETLFGSLTFNDSKEHYEEILKFETNENMTDTYTNYIQSELHNMHEQLDYLKNQSTISLKILDAAFDYLKTNESRENVDNVLSEIRNWARYLEFEFDSYIYWLKTVIEAIYLSKAGVLHPDLFTTETIREAIREFLTKNPHQNLVLPIFNDKQINLSEMLKISKTDVGYYSGKITMVINIPLLDSTVYHLSKMYPYPTQQMFGAIGGSAFVQPRMDYLLTARNRYTFARFEDLNKCMNVSNTYICRYKNPIYDANFRPTCESSIVMKKKHKRVDTFSNCNVKISSTFKPQWTQINSGWLYSLPEAESLILICQGEWRKAVNISGVGILQIKPGCYAETSHMIIKGAQTNFKHLDDYTSSIVLNVTSLLPSIKYFNFIPQQYTQLAAVQQKIKENLYYEQEENQQNSVIAMILVGQVLLVFLFLLVPCIISSKSRNVQVLTIRQTPV